MRQKWQNRLLLKLEIPELVPNLVKTNKKRFLLSQTKKKSLIKPNLIFKIAKKRTLPQMTRGDKRLVFSN
jgi:hypothetical protein